MKQSCFTILSNEKIAEEVYKMSLAGDTSAVSAPGQFVNIKIEGFYLRRPISLFDYDDKGITLIYKLVGGGTHAMSEMCCGMQLDILTGLGNGFDISKSGDAPLLIGGGVGVPPLYKLSKELFFAGKKVSVILGFNSACDVFCEKEFAHFCDVIKITTADGSYGMKGFVTDAVKDMDYSYFYSCGPEAMFKALNKTLETDGQFSFEERMGCGFGACMGCSCKTLTGNKRICKEGPVLERNEIIWKD